MLNFQQSSVSHDPSEIIQKSETIIIIIIIINVEISFWC